MLFGHLTTQSNVTQMKYEIPKYSHKDYIQGSLSNCKMYFGGGGGGVIESEG